MGEVVNADGGSERCDEEQEAPQDSLLITPTQSCVRTGPAIAAGQLCPPLPAKRLQDGTTISPINIRIPRRYPAAWI
ncbi:MAG: hypothetical protein HYT77_04070 [Deltaproteobacteria bacterium]|nr:hypothetical protein [Deltaproteobacteria bacterium]